MREAMNVPSGLPLRRSDGTMRGLGGRSMELTDDDVLEILKLFEQSQFDFLELQEGERKITVSKGGYVPASAKPAVPAPAAAKAQAASVPAASGVATAVAPAPRAPSAPPEG